MKNTGVIRKIDELGRIVIPKEIRKNLNIRNGEDVQIFVEEDKIVLKKYQKILSIQENAQRYLDLLSRFFSGCVLLSDKEKIIASSDKDYVNLSIDVKLISLINDRRQELGYGITLGDEKLNKHYFLFPVIVDADAIGSILILSDKEIIDRDKVVVEILNALFSKDLY